MLTKKRFLMASAGLILLLNISVLLKDVVPLPSALVTFGILCFLPGVMLAMLLRLKQDNPLYYCYYAVCLSILWMISVGLFANTVLPLIGIKDPLHVNNTLPLINTFLLLLWAGVVRRGEQSAFGWKFNPTEKMERISYVVPLALIVLSVVGAVSLNNNYTNAFTIVMLLGVLADFVWLYLQADKINGRTLAFHIFGCALALLLMTSMRGWLITGHDIQREFFVFQLTKANWHWDVAAFRDPYNACLSITILPTMLSGLVGISDSNIYKVLYQILFALSPVVVYLLAKRISNRGLAVIATLYYVAFPTFFQDMPMLNRQELAFLFFGGMLLLIADRTQRYRVRLLLFSMFGLGIILSHYSTTYSMVLILSCAAVLTFLFEHRWFGTYLNWMVRPFRRGMPLFIGTRRHQPLIIFPMLVLLVLVAMLWNGQITGTSRGVSDTVKNALNTLAGTDSSEFKSTDTGVSLLGGAKNDPQDKVDGYKKIQDGIREDLPDQQTYYPLDEVSKYPLKAAPEQPAPLNPWGNVLHKLGLDVFGIHSFTRQTSAKLLQVLVVIGLLTLLFPVRKRYHLTAEMSAISIACMAFLALLVLIPVLSLNYGLLRAFQQVLLILALPVVLGSMFLLSKLPRKKAGIAALAIAAAFFLSSTGLLAESTGGYLTPLHLHNAGIYYDSYYIHEGEVAAIDWLGNRVGPIDRESEVQSDVQADRFAESKLRALASYQAEPGAYPGLVQKDSYVFIGYTNATKHIAYALYKEEGITYYYPAEFLDNNKDLIYSNGQAKVYR